MKLTYLSTSDTTSVTIECEGMERVTGRKFRIIGGRFDDMFCPVDKALRIDSDAPTNSEAPLTWKEPTELPPAEKSCFSKDVLVDSPAGYYVGYLDTETGKWHESYSGDAVASQFTPRRWAYLPQ